MDLIDQLRRDRRFYAQCPSCGREFQLSKAVLFHLKKPLPPQATQKLRQMREELSDRRAALKQARKSATEGAAITAESVNLGKIVEKIVPSFRSFAFSPRDCRALFEPIDYLVFPGLASRSAAEAILFVDVKSGKARLTPGQSAIRDVVERGKVELRRIPKRRST